MEGDLAYLADGAPGLRILDVGQPSAPTEIGSLDTPVPFNKALEQMTLPKGRLKQTLQELLAY